MKEAVYTACCCGQIRCWRRLEKLTEGKQQGAAHQQVTAGAGSHLQARLRAGDPVKTKNELELNAEMC